MRHRVLQRRIAPTLTNVSLLRRRFINVSVTARSLEACGNAPENCVAECDAVWARDRQALYRECVAEAGDNCDAVNACTVQPGIPCDAACARLSQNAVMQRQIVSTSVMTFTSGSPSK